MDYREVNVMAENVKDFADGKTILKSILKAAALNYFA